MRYDKKVNIEPYVKPNGRILNAVGPRAQQSRIKAITSGSMDIDILRKEIELLKADLKSKPKVSTEESIDNLLNEEIDKVIKELTTKHEIDLNSLKNEIKNLNSIIETKNELIETLKNSGLNKPINTVDGSENLPTIEEHFIDPSDKNKEYESFVKVKEEAVSDKGVQDQLNKLKDIMGKKGL